MSTYAKVGPPFDFQGSLTVSQKEAFFSWIDTHTSDLPEEQKWWQIRAQQLRKTAGCLEGWYAESNDLPLKTRWSKEPWKVGDTGWSLPIQRDSQLPSVVVGALKDTFKEQLKRGDEGMFQMGHVRTLIEKAEDAAQRSFEATAKVPTLKAELDSMFGQPEFEGVLIDDKNDLFNGAPKYRLSPLDPPTEWELLQTAQVTTLKDTSK